MRRLICLTLLLWLLVSFAAGPVVQAALETNIDVKEFQLENGMMFLLVKRSTTPQVAVRLAIRAGSALEETGKTGIAHLLEHMMFKGTKNFGSLDIAKDKDLQEKIEAAYQVILKEEQKRQPNLDLIKAKQAEMETLRQEVQKIYVPQVFSSQLGKNGAVGINAFTSKDQTQYIASVPSDMLEQWFSIISEQLFEPSWREFYVEKDVVQREWAFRYINNPNGAAWLDLSATAYSAHPYRNPTIGWRADMERFNTTDAMAFHRKYYNPTNAVCVLVGDLTIQQARQMAQTYFGRYTAGPKSPESVTSEPPQEGSRQSVRYLRGARTPLVRIAFHGAPMGTRDFYALDVLTMVLSQGRGARLTQNIVNKGLAVEAWAGNPDNRYGGQIILGGSPNEPANLPVGDQSEEERRRIYLDACRKLEAILLEEIAQIKKNPVSEKDLARIKKLNRKGFIERMRSNESLAGTLATLEVQVGWRYLNTYLERIESITADDVQRAARTYIRSDNQTSVYVIPGGKPEKPPAVYSEVRSVGGSAAARLTRPKNLKNNSVYPTPKNWKHPLSFQRQPVKIAYPDADVLPVNGATMVYIQDKELPLVDVDILIKAGEVDIDSSQTGLADILTHSLIDGGTSQYEPEELARLLDENAIEVSISVGEEETVVKLSILKDDWEKGLALLQEILTRPAFKPEVVDVIKDQTLVSLKRQGENAQAVAMREGLIWHFSGHPYGRDPLRGLETIPKITRQDLSDFMRAYFVPSNMVVAVSGDITKKAALTGIGKLLKSLPQNKAPVRRLDDPVPQQPVLAFINKPGQVQSQVILALTGMKRTHPEFWKMRLLADIYGGSDSLMYTRLRDDLGLVYSAGFFQTYKWNAGLLMGYIGCRGDQTRTAIKETINLMVSLRDRIPTDELERKRLEALNSFVFNVDTPSMLASTYSRYQMRGEPLDTLDKIQDAYIAATDEDLLELAREYLNPNSVQIFIVGDKSTRVKSETAGDRTLEDDLSLLAQELKLPFRRIQLR
jgi:predicted Zn-dependent peptidase